METKTNALVVGFRFPKNFYSKIYVTDPENGIVVGLRVFHEEKTLQLNILQELDSGLLRIMSRRNIPCKLDDSGYLIDLNERFNEPISYKSVKAGFEKDSTGNWILYITHDENGKTIEERFFN